MRSWSSYSQQEQQQLLARPMISNSQSVTDTVADIIAQVRNEGDAALFRLGRQFDKAQLNQLALSKARLADAEAEVSPQVKAGLTIAYNNIHRFHSAQQPQDFAVETTAGVLCEMRHSPIAAVGLYIPGGTAPLPSTVLMLGVAAQVAGCKRKVLCTPPNAEGEIAPEIRYAATLCGIDEIYLVGGAQAVAALALGTESIAKVDKIFGPGNRFVTEAKQQVSQLPGGPAIDMPAGPSEVLVLADANANSAFVASDLLSQAEHGVDSQAILVSDSAEQISATQAAVTAQLAQLGRCEIATQAMENARYILAADLEECIAISNQYAPEHLIVHFDNARNYLSQLDNAGSIFLGQWSPESAGDYASGTNHVLPTYGYARNYSSLGLMDFYRRYTVQELSQEGLLNIGPAIMDVANAEGLDAHKNAVAIRLQQFAQGEERG